MFLIFSNKGDINLIFGWNFENETVCISRPMGIHEACKGVLGIQDICHFNSRDIGYFPFYFQGYGILFSISGIKNI